MTRLRQGFGGQAAAVKIIPKIIPHPEERRAAARHEGPTPPSAAPQDEERDAAGQSPASASARPQAPRAERGVSAEGLNEKNQSGPSLLRATRAWGRAPDWVVALAAECDATSQAKAALRIDYSPSVVNQVLANCYRGQIERVERAVRLALLPEQVRCPVLGVITTTKCAIEQNLPLSIANPLRVALRRACGRCPNREEQK